MSFKIGMFILFAVIGLLSCQNNNERSRVYKCFFSTTGINIDISASGFSSEYLDRGPFGNDSYWIYKVRFEANDFTHLMEEVTNRHVISDSIIFQRHAKGLDYYWIREKDYLSYLPVYPNELGCCEFLRVHQNTQSVTMRLKPQSIELSDYSQKEKR